MTSESQHDSPIINPVLSLLKEAIPKQGTARGRTAKQGMKERLPAQRKKLVADCNEIVEKIRQGSIAHGGFILILAEMFEDYIAPTWTPYGLLNERQYECRLVSPAKGGYLAEIPAEKISKLAEIIASTNEKDSCIDISCIKSIKLFDQDLLFPNIDANSTWQKAEKFERGKGFIFWLAPYRNRAARDSVLQKIRQLEAEQILLPTYPDVALPVPGADPTETAKSIISKNQSAMAYAMRHYQNKGTTQAFSIVSSKAAWERILSSGAFVRIDPVRRIEVTAPGIGAEPTPPIPIADQQPIIAVIDGGLTAKSYLSLEAWRAPPLIKNSLADHVHGNCVTSLAVHGHAWNNNLALPAIDCRVGTVQAVPKKDSTYPSDLQQLVEYLRQVAHNFPEGKIWNMSFNQDDSLDDLDTVSYLGHKIAELARDFGILPIISVGNRKAAGSPLMCPPADCEAALTVSGRGFNKKGLPDGPCPVSLKGPGPDGMLKPDLSWYSKLRMIGGLVRTGSSYAVPLVSSLAAHTYANLKEPAPDLVKALLINRADLVAHDEALGWGTPWDGAAPWACAPGTVTLIWKAKLKPGFGYYWQDIPIPPEMIEGAKLVGKGSLTAVLNPMVSPVGGPNYFATRLEVALQYKNARGKFDNLLGSMEEGKKKESIARAELAKWNPVRRHVKDFSRGRSFSGNSLRLYARVYGRDSFQFGLSGNRDFGEQEVVFVLTLSNGSNNPAIFNSMAQQLGNLVESAVINQEVEISHNA